MIIGGYGMPSSHAQTLFFFLMVISCYLTGLSTNGVSNTHTVPLLPASSLVISMANGHRYYYDVMINLLLNVRYTAQKYFASILHAMTNIRRFSDVYTYQKVLLTGMGVMMTAWYTVSASLWRVKTKLHTLPQTMVGAIVGALMGLLAYLYQNDILYSLLSPTANTANLSNTVITDFVSKYPVPVTFKGVTLVVGFFLLYSKELKAVYKHYKEKSTAGNGNGNGDGEILMHDYTGDYNAVEQLIRRAKSRESYDDVNRRRSLRIQRRQSASAQPLQGVQDTYDGNIVIDTPAGRQVVPKYE